MYVQSTHHLNRSYVKYILHKEVVLSGILMQCVKSEHFTNKIQ